MEKIIIIDGLDGVGKSKISKALAQMIAKEKKTAKVYYEHFPYYESPSGKYIKDMLYGKVGNNFSLYEKSIPYIMNRYEYMISYPNIFRDYDYIIFDRNYLSNLIYQTVDMISSSQLKDYMQWCLDNDPFISKIYEHITKVHNIILTFHDFDNHMKCINMRHNKKDKNESENFLMRVYNNERWIYDQITRMKNLQHVDINLLREASGLENLEEEAIDKIIEEIYPKQFKVFEFDVYSSDTEEGELKSIDNIVKDLYIKYIGV